MCPSYNKDLINEGEGVNNGRNKPGEGSTYSPCQVQRGLSCGVIAAEFCVVISEVALGVHT